MEKTDIGALGSVGRLGKERNARAIPKQANADIHRVVMEGKLGRKLTSKNILFTTKMKNRKNFDPSNLQLKYTGAATPRFISLEGPSLKNTEKISEGVRKAKCLQKSSLESLGQET